MKYWANWRQKMMIPQPSPPTQREIEDYESQMRFFKWAREESHLYTVMPEWMRLGLPEPKKGAITNPFEDMPSYSSKYKRKDMSLPRWVKGEYSECAPLLRVSWDDWLIQSLC